VIFRALALMRAGYSDVIWDQRARQGFAEIEPAVIERNELQHGALPRWTHHHYRIRVCCRGDENVAER